MSEFVKRYVSTVVAIGILALVFYIGYDAIAVVSVLIGFLMIFEFNRAAGIRGNLIGYVGAIALFSAAVFGFSAELSVAVMCTLHVLFFVFTPCTLKEFSLASLSILYIPLPIYFGLRLLFTYGLYTFLLTLLIPMCTDIFAYVVGRLFGRTPLVPKISPKKTVEGLIGGLLFSSLFSVLYIRFLLKGNLFGLPSADRLWVFVLLTLVFSAFSQFGDFAASKIKREIGLKDYGDVIPGHGGMLDRFDSYLLVFPAFYTILKIMSQMQ